MAKVVAKPYGNYHTLHLYQQGKFARTGYLVDVCHTLMQQDIKFLVASALHLLPVQFDLAIGDVASKDLVVLTPNWTLDACIRAGHTQATILVLVR